MLETSRWSFTYQKMSEDGLASRLGIGISSPIERSQLCVSGITVSEGDLLFCPLGVWDIEKNFCGLSS